MKPRPISESCLHPKACILGTAHTQAPVLQGQRVTRSCCSPAALLMEKYRKCGFAHLWAASAFKGATGASQALTPIEHHLQNHVQWLQVAAQAPASALQGIVLTGWQRWVPIQAHLVGGVPPHGGQL